jgi:aminoglycoside/choline kinase family phosphotransferase
VAHHCQATLTPKETEDLASLFETLVNDNIRSEKVLVHRDFHSPNLMLCTEPRFGANPGIIDYQDALAGPITYDIASLVMDARTTWEEPQQLDWAIRYWEYAQKLNLPVDNDFADFHRAYEWMSLQRNLRILGVFSRLSLRDGKHHYLDHIPRVLTYVRQVAERYGQFKPLLRLLDRLEGKTRVMGLSL